MGESSVREIIEGMLNMLGVVYDGVEISDSGIGAYPRYIIKSAESGLLIGQKGETLLALNHVVKKIVAKKKSEEDANFFLDVNDYQDKLIQEIRNKVLILKERAKLFQRNVEMEPGSAYERMIVHSACADDPEIETESFGQGKSRRVVIKYKARQDAPAGGQDIGAI